ncbi:uncharacterized protein [Nicotiana tomentosiformis]|uniref:uncharacterized protein n=1 Tax=Nicotiana tomentosiformis TaxID=4098 RepID=UPI00051BCA7B|nr:putative uncharacterized protein DDB_G0277255 [Nicotiana tomentosiformis]
MDIKRVAAAQEYEDFVPTSMMVQEKDYDTLLFNLSGFKKEQVKVELCKTGNLTISGQRPVNKWQRFQKVIPVSENCDKSKISARFVNSNILCVKYPKLIISEEKKDKNLPPSATSQKTTLKDNAENGPTKEPVLKEEPKNIIPKTNEQTEAKSLPKSTSGDGKTTSLFTKPDDQSINDKELPQQDQNTASIDEPKINNSRTGEQTRVKPDNDNNNNNNNNNNNSASIPNKLGPAGDLFAKLKMRKEVINMTLVALLFLCVGRCAINVMKSPKKAKE